MSEKMVVGSQNFSGGLVTVQPAHLLEEGQTPNCQNVDFSESVGRLTRRKGYSVLQNANQSLKVVGLHEHVANDGTTTLYAAVNDDVYELTTPSTWTSRFTAASNNGERIRFLSTRLLAADSANTTIIVGKNLTTSKVVPGGAASTLLGTPPSNAKYIAAHKNKIWIANHGASSIHKNRLNFSASLNAEDWTTSNDAGYFDIDPGDGDEITGIQSIGSALIIFKNWATYALRGDTAATFKVSKISPNVGCVAPDSIVRADTFAIFLSNQGVYAATDTGVALLSYSIKPTLDSLSNAIKSRAVGGRYRTQYWLCVDEDADGDNEVVYYLDFVFGIWGRYTNKKCGVFTTRLNGDLLSGSSVTDEIHLQNDTDNDDGGAINMIWDSPDYDGGDWAKIKRAYDFVTAVSPISGKTLTISHLLNGVVQGTTMTQDLTPVATEDKVYLRYRHFPDTSYSAYIRFRLSNNETDAPINVYGYSAVLNVLERANG